MRKFKMLLAITGAAFLLSGCHFAGHHPPGHGGIPPGQAKKGGWHSPPGHRTPPGHRRFDESRLDAAPKFY